MRTADYLPQPIRSAFEQAMAAKRFTEAEELLSLTTSLPSWNVEPPTPAAQPIALTADEWQLINTMLVHCLQGGGPFMDQDEEDALAEVIGKLGRDACFAKTNGVLPCR